jgi:DNA-binding response OmpR family regulator/class 3 adenylate cyclase
MLSITHFLLHERIEDRNENAASMRWQRGNSADLEASVVEDSKPNIPHRPDVALVRWSRERTGLRRRRRQPARRSWSNENHRMISLRQNHRTISTNARIGAKRSILVVAQQIELRARIARVLHSAGYAVELAESQKRALEVATRAQIEAAIVVLSSDLAGLSEELRDKVPRTIVLGHRTDEIIRQDHSMQGANALSGQALDKQKLLDELGRPMTSPWSRGDETGPEPVLKIKDCKLDLSGYTFIDGNGREVNLTRAESALLATFAGNPCRVLSRDQLTRAVVRHGAGPYGRNIDMVIARLRRKIEPNPKSPQFIMTVPGRGYKLAPRPQGFEDGQTLPTIDLERRKESQTAWLKQSGFDGVKATSVPGQAGSPHSDSGRRQVSVLSCGLIGSTALAVNLDPEDFGSTILRFQDICTSVITRWGGAVINSVGGEILAVYGYPQANEDDAERAVRAGLDLLTDISALVSPSAEPMQARIAIATGLVVVGEDQSVVGEPVVTAGPLQNKIPPNSVTITASTRKLLGNVFVYNDPELHEFDGLSEPVTAYRITGKRAVESRFAARRTGKLTQLVGRQHELQQLSKLWELTKGGKGQVALLCGEAGIGKSRVCEDWLDGIADEPHITIRYQCSSHHTNSPFYPVIDQLAHAARFEREDAPDVRLRKLEAVLSQAGAATLADIPFLAALLSIPTDGFCCLRDLTPQQQRDLTIAALLRQVLGLAITQPVVIALSDAHWIDSSTLELFSRCIASIKTARVFILVSFRPEFFPQWLNQAHVTMLRLNRLPRKQTGAIILDVAEHKELPPELHEQIIRKADGIPLFAQELTKSLLESGQLQDTGERYVTIGPPLPLAIPKTLLGSLTACLDRVGPNKEIAQIGAAIGREFSYRLLAAIVPGGSLPLNPALADLLARELILVRGEPPDSTYVFKYALVQDAAYASITRSKRQLFHSRIADALVEGFPETVETQPELIAHHLAQAGLPERAIEYLRKARRARSHVQ